MYSLRQATGQPWIKKTAIAGSSIAGLLTLWLVGGNLWAAQREQSTQKNWIAFKQKFPAKSANTSAQTLEKLATKLGLPALVIPPSSTADDTMPKNHRQFEQFSTYNKTQIFRPDSTIDSPPEPLKAYYDAQAENIAAIRQYLLQEAIPQWEQLELKTDLASEVLPSFGNLIYLNHLLIFDALQNVRGKQPQAAYDSLKASMRLSKSFYQSPTLIHQLVALITATDRMGVLRKMDGLPSKWLTELKAPDAKQQFLNVLKHESFLTSDLYLRNFSRWNDPVLGNDGHSFTGTVSNSLSARSGQFLLNPYFRFAALDYQEKIQPILKSLPTQNVCAFDDTKISQTAESSGSWWNPVRWHSNTYENVTPNFMQLWLRLNQHEIQWEFTEKLQSLKQVVRETGKIPQVTPGFASSSICPESRWTHKASGKDKINVTLEKIPTWWKHDYKGLPIQFELKNPSS
jgi:hypothetical protein